MALITGQGSGGGKISGVTVSGTAASGQVPVASSSSAGAWGYPPGYEFGYDQITSTVNVTATTEATSTSVISCAAHTFDGGPVMLNFYALVQWPNAGATQALFSLWEGASDLGIFCLAFTATAVVQYEQITGQVRFTPTAASHTYTIKCFGNSATGVTVAAGDGGVGHNPVAFARFTKV